MPPSDLSKTYSLANLEKAWRWIKSNPEANYKSYFRPIYSSYAAAEHSYLNSLHQRLNLSTYQPSATTKIFVPKPSGILRPITLLTVEDQIVYQAFANQIAIKLSRRIKKRYFREIFGHIYAGPSSIWFYKDWRKCFSKYNKAIKDAVNTGYDYAASFDLTACYDSIDHKVLSHYLHDLGFSTEFIVDIVKYLGVWTALNQQNKQSKIYLGHGIPQGPISSGIFSELILQAFDDNKSLPKKVKYLRYVDDIRLYAKNEKDLRISLILLDYSSKYVGLFPQSSKINIRKVTDILDEIKTISYPPEPMFINPSLDQDSTHKRINELSIRYVVKDQTRFKYAVASALPRSMQSKRLIKILIKYPHLYSTILNYFSRYNKVPKAICKELYSILSNDDPPYFTLQSELLRNTCGLIDGVYKSHFIKFCEKKWKILNKIKYAEDYRKSLILWLITENRLPYNKLKDLFLTEKYDTWFKSRILFYVDEDFVGSPSYEDLLNKIIRKHEGDVSIVASYLLLSHNCNVLSPRRDIMHLPSIGLKEFGLIKTRNAPDSEIPRCLREITKANLPKFNWKKEFRSDHKYIQNKFIVNTGYITTDATAWIMSLDVIMDTILNQLAIHDNSIGNYQLGNIGGFISSTTSQFARNYPQLYATCKNIHDYRKKADLSHAVIKNTRKPTERIKFSVIKKLQPVIYHGFRELILSW